MNVMVSSLERPPVDAWEVETVERKGLGHPDTICDAVAERFGTALCRFYAERFGMVLHYNVDKALLWGGASRPAFGGGEVQAPWEIFLSGRATCEYQGVRVPVEDLARASCDEWLRQNFHALDPARHVKVHCLVRPGSADLVDLYSRQRQTGVWLANDTSCGVGYAPLSPLERAVLEVERGLNSRQIKQSHPAIGEDIKVLGIRCRGDVRLTLACAMVDRHVSDLEAYLAQTAEAGRLAREAAESIVQRPVQVDFNAADDAKSGDIYLTVTGTSAETGDDGQVGRGNRANGLITPYRPMVMEAAAAKNPVTHVGKIYNVVAQQIAEATVRELPEVAEVECYLVSQIGRPVCQPQIVDIKVRLAGDTDVRRLEPRICAIAEDQLSRAGTLWERIVAREIKLY